MSLCPAISRRSISYFNSEICYTCRLQAHQSRFVRRYAVRSTNGQQKVVAKKPQKYPTDIGGQYQSKLFKALFADRLLPMKPRDADSLITDFLAAEKDRIDPATNVHQLAKRYRIKVAHINFLAIPLLRPQVIGNAPFSAAQQQSIARRLLVSLSAAKDSMATLQILAAIYHNGNAGIPGANAIARLFSPPEIKSVMKTLEQLAEGGDTDCMTLHGQFLEKQGQKDRAKLWYERAWEMCSTSYDPYWPHPRALPRDPPWIALARLLLAENTPEAREKAKVTLEKGALKAGDPLAFYQLACLEDETTSQWFTYMSKAAASGHTEAAYKLGRFFLNVDADPKAYLNNTQLAKALNFVVGWKNGSASRLAEEWFSVAATAGHKPSMLELAELESANGNTQSATKWLRLMTEPPRAGRVEEWPKLVELAKQRLASPRLQVP